MKIFAAFAPLLCLISGCAEDTLGTTREDTFEEYLASVPRERSTGRYIVDWDVVVTTEEEVRRIWRQSSSGALSILSFEGEDIKWPPQMQRQLSYCVSDTFGARKPAVVEAMRAATTLGWAKHANLRFIYDPAQDATCDELNEAVVFDVRPVSDGQYLARAFFPGYPREYCNILIDDAAFEQDRFLLENIMLHEVGHALGFRHEHIARPGQSDPLCVEDEYYRVVESYDPLSTMHYPSCGSPSNTLALSALDRSGVAVVYGPPPPPVAPYASVTQPIDGSVVGLSFDVVASIIDDDLDSVTLLVDGEVVPPRPGADYAFAVTTTPGEHALELVVTDTAGLEDRVALRVTARPLVPAEDDGADDETDDGNDGAVIDPIDDGGCGVSGRPSSLLVMLAACALLGRSRRRGRDRRSAAPNKTGSHRA